MPKSDNQKSNNYLPWDIATGIGLLNVVINSVVVSVVKTKCSKKCDLMKYEQKYIEMNI